jgi:L-ascorbate 6-phosphate lactonase
MSESLGITWLGQSGFLYQFPGSLAVCLDPYLSHSARAGRTKERLTPIVVPATHLRADLVITTHEHSDHFDEVSLRPLAERAATLFAGPSSCRARWLAMGLPAERFLRLDVGEAREVAGVRLRATYAEHSSGDGRDAIGVIIEASGFRVYQTGDSEYNERVAEGVRELGPDLLTVPINGRLGNMDHEGAADLTAAVRPRVVIPNHYGMFRDNTADPQRFLDACQRRGLDARIVIAQPGQRFGLARGK